MYKKYSVKAQKISYYISDKDDIQRPFISILLDSFLLVLLFFVGLYLWIVYRTKSPLTSILISLLTTSLFAYGIYLKKHALLAKNRAEKHKFLARDYMIDRLALLSRQEFEWQIVKALSAVDGLSDIEQRQGYLKARYYDTPLAIGYHQAPPKGYETYERVWEFYTALKAKGYNRIIYISSGYFEEPCNNIHSYNPDVSITLLDIEGLLDLMESAGMGPSDEVIEDMVVQRISHEKRRRRESRKGVSPLKKSKKYMISSVIFLGASFLFRAYFLFYIVLSILFFVLGLLSLLLPLRGKSGNTKIPQ